MKRWGEQKPLRLDNIEMKTHLGSGNFIFVGSSTDMFAADVCGTWITSVLNFMSEFENSYLLQSKNPYGFIEFEEIIPNDTVVCTTIETNRWYSDIMGNSPYPWDRALSMEKIQLQKYVTIEPIMDFDLDKMVELIRMCDPVQVNIGSDSGKNNLPEPSRDKLIALIDEVKKFTTIHKKLNLERLMRGKE
jgi:hypothetical protein